MAFVKTLIAFLLWPFISVSAEKKLPQFITKQPHSAIRYVSNDDSLSFYQKRTGSLIFSQNFKLTEVLKGPAKTYYFVIAGSEKKKFLIIKDPFFTNAHSVRHKQEIYVFDIKDKTTKLLGRGISPKLHFFESWATFYDPHQKKIYVKSLVSDSLSYTLNIKSTNAPYFIPEVLVLSNNTVLLTDVNKKEHLSIFQFNRSEKKMRSMYLSSAPGTKVEFCQLKGNIYFGEFGLNPSSGKSVITGIDSKGKFQSFYQSDSSDLGNLICHKETNRLYFIKVFPIGKSTYEYTSEVVALDPKTKKINIISKLKNVTQVINMDGRILIPHQGVLLIAHGNEIKDDSLN